MVEPCGFPARGSPSNRCVLSGPNWLWLWLWLKRAVLRGQHLGCDPGVAGRDFHDQHVDITVASGAMQDQLGDKAHRHHLYGEDFQQ